MGGLFVKKKTDAMELRYVFPSARCVFRINFTRKAQSQ